jgi:hypothetical protein
VIPLFSRRQRYALDSFRERPNWRREGTRDSKLLTPVVVKDLSSISHPQKACQSFFEILKELDIFEEKMIISACSQQRKEAHARG